MRAEIREIALDVRAQVGLREEAVEGGVIGEAARRFDLELVERDVRRIEVDRGDLDVGRRQIAQNVAPARRDADEFLAVLERQRFEVDDRIFPDLRIDEAREGQREQALLDSAFRDRLVAVNGLLQSREARLRRAGRAARRCLFGRSHQSPRMRLPGRKGGEAQPV